jgi:hypothetical protein
MELKKLIKKNVYLFLPGVPQALKQTFCTVDETERKERNRRVRCPAKGNTLLNYCGITTDLVDYTVIKSLQTEFIRREPSSRLSSREARR